MRTIEGSEGNTNRFSARFRILTVPARSAAPLRINQAIVDLCNILFVDRLFSPTKGLSFQSISLTVYLGRCRLPRTK